MLAAFLKALQPLLCLIVAVMSAQVSPVGAGQAFAIVHLCCCNHQNLIMP